MASHHILSPSTIMSSMSRWAKHSWQERREEVKDELNICLFSHFRLVCKIVAIMKDFRILQCKISYSVARNI